MARALSIDIGKETKTPIGGGKKMDFDVVNRCLNSQVSTEPLTVSEEKEMIRRFKLGEQKARDRLIESNLRFVVKLALSNRNQGVALPDLIQEGTLGLIEALEKFDESKECRLITYASWWIRLYMQRALEQKNWQVNLPINKMELLRKIRGFSKAYELTHGHEPTVEEIAEELKMDADKIRDLNDHTPTFHSIHTQDEESPGLEKILVDDNQTDVRDSMWRKEAINRLNQAMNVLSSKERQVLAYRYKLNKKGRKLSLRKVGQQLGLSAEGVRRIEAQAMSKLRRPHVLANMANLFAA